MQNYTFKKLSKQMVPELVDLITSCYQKYSPVFIDLDMYVENFKGYIKQQLLDEKIYPLSFALVEETKNKIIGVKILQDFSNINYNYQRYQNPKQQFKHDLDCQILSEFINKKFSYGEACNQSILAVDPYLEEEEIKKVLHLMYEEHLRILYINNYKLDISILYSNQHYEIATQIGGYLSNKYDIREVPYNGQLIFKNNNEGAMCYVIEIDDDTIKRIFGNGIISYKQKLLSRITRKDNRINYAQNKIKLAQPKL